MIRPEAQLTSVRILHLHCLANSDLSVREVRQEVPDDWNCSLGTWCEISEIRMTLLEITDHTSMSRSRVNEV